MRRRQSNAASNEAAASNTNDTEQAVAQGQAGDATATGKHGDAAVIQDQAADVSNGTDQAAVGTADNDQANKRQADDQRQGQGPRQGTRTTAQGPRQGEGQRSARAGGRSPVT